LLWNRETDLFTMGQWLKGRIHAERSDLSPDGRYFNYAAPEYPPNRHHRGDHSNLTAVTPAPYLTAIQM
jgi:hypothetical protein